MTARWGFTVLHLAPHEKYTNIIAEVIDTSEERAVFVATIYHKLWEAAGGEVLYVRRSNGANHYFTHTHILGKHLKT